MNIISKKKISYAVGDHLRHYINTFGRGYELPVSYDDLLRFSTSVPLLDKNDNDTLWETPIYPSHLVQEISRGLIFIYSLLKTGGETSVMEHLTVDRVDYCTFGNSNPFRIRIVNQFNDNYDYFYLKKADASRIYGLELEHLLSPNRISYLVSEETLIEEHIAGIPGDEFLRRYLDTENLSRVRIAKEFVKFNERCFVRLLGDMRAYNYVVDITPDFEEEQYRIRAIDFDQQSYEGRRTMYLPQFFKENLPIVQICIDRLNKETVKQYQFEERTLVARRFKSSYDKIQDLLGAMAKEIISTDEKIDQLKRELASFHRNNRFLRCSTMGEIVSLNIEVLLSIVTSL